MPTLKKTLWMLNRLASMSPPEVMHRIAERRRRAKGRKYDGWGALAVRWGRFVPFEIDPSELAALADSCRADWEGIAEACRTGRWNYLGQK